MAFVSLAAVALLLGGVLTGVLLTRGGDNGDTDETSESSDPVARLKNAYSSCDSTNSELSPSGTSLSVDAPNSDAYMFGMACVLEELDPPQRVLALVEQGITDGPVFETVEGGGLIYAVVAGTPGSGKLSLVVGTR